MRKRGLSKRGYIGAFVASFVLLLLFSHSVHGLKVYVNDVDTEVSEKEVAVYNLSLFNDAMYTDEFKMYVPDVRWSAQTDPLSYYQYGFTLKPEEQIYLPLYVKPRKGTPEGRYQFALEIEPKKGEMIEKVMGIKVVPPTPVVVIKDYDRDVDVDPIVPPQVDSRETFNIQVVLTNNNPLSYEDVEVKLESSLFERSIKTELNGNKTKKLDFAIDLDDKEAPGEYEIKVSVLFEGKEFYSVNKDLEVVMYLPPFETTETVDELFLKTIRRIKLRNDANIAKEREVRVKISGWKSLFLRTEPESYVEKLEGQKYLTWNIELDPGKSTVVTLNYDYRPLFIALVMLIIVIILYQVLKSPIIVSKQISEIETKDNAVSEMQVIITLKNRRGRAVRNMTIVEKVPKIAYVINEFTHTLAPKKVYKYREGTVVKWVLDIVDPKEERIISYRIKTKLSLIGAIKLKPTIAEYIVDGKNKKMISLSNSLDIVAE